VRRPCDRLGRGAPPRDSASLCPLLQRSENAPIVGQRRAILAPGSADRKHHVTGAPRRIASPIRASLSFRYTQWVFTNRVRTMGIRDRPISPRSPWQNAYVERLIETLRRECLDHVLIYGERHLRRILILYSLYYNETRTHLGLGKDTPLRRSVQRSGPIVTIPILSGLHHRYERI
jgi:hypothetical protein